MKIFICHICGEVYIGPSVPPTCPFCGADNKLLRLGHVWVDANIGVEPTEREKELLQEALEIELSNVSFYECVSKTCSTLEVAKMFKALKKQETEHAEVFEKLLKPESLPDIKETCIDDPKKALEDSSARESKAIAFYTKALSESTTPRIKELFEAILDVEKTHKELDEIIGEKYK